MVQRRECRRTEVGVVVGELGGEDVRKLPRDQQRTLGLHRNPRERGLQRRQSHRRPLRGRARAAAAHAVDALARRLVARAGEGALGRAAPDRALTIPPAAAAIPLAAGALRGVLTSRSLTAEDEWIRRGGLIGGGLIGGGGGARRLA